VRTAQTARMERTVTMALRARMERMALTVEPF
jgi:hypothetical protein